MTEKVYLTVLL